MDFRDYDIDYNYPQPPLPPLQKHNGNADASSSSSSPDLLTTYRCVLLNYPANSSSNSLTYYTLWLLNSNPLYPPTDFTPIHHAVYQLTQLLLLVYVVLVKCHLKTLMILMGYSVLQVSWGLLVLKSIDVFTWNSLVSVVVAVKCVRALCKSWWGGGSSGAGGGTHPHSAKKKKQLLFSPSSSRNGEVDQIYTRLFAPVRVSYKQFLRVVGCKRGFKVLGCGENYSVEKRSRVDSLGLLVSGRLVVSQGGKALHVILPFQFVDSPEYFGVATDELFQVTITALEDSKLLVWHRDKLRLTIMNDEFLRVMFDHIIGRDVVRKLIQVSDSIMTTPITTTSSLSSPVAAYNSATLTTTTTTTTSNGGTNNGAPPSSPTGAAPTTNLLTSLSQHHGGVSTITTTSPGSNQQQQPIVVMRKDKYAYQPTYLTSLSEEKLNKSVEEDEDDDTIQDNSITGNEKRPMLDEDEEESYDDQQVIIDCAK